MTTLEQHNVPLSDEIKEASALTEYAVETRYPGPFEPVTETDYSQAIEMAERVVQWAEKILEE